ncbi:hypothetical protein HXX76_008927 [Chlamydomonas incerta]|uniref:Uncharacterized protein n=1 Tax=Chlamydomonas incerta TaxID=51695 RepID=A0A835W0E5_CHLIN|nr:hypothetical protein HXX76_008927 [Chlamydomonas incerta]|eukprot:KAG2432583.1 hypothetical protein HXX76_008927 [Chlamydomonas incerta]
MASLFARPALALPRVGQQETCCSSKVTFAAPRSARTTLRVAPAAPSPSAEVSGRSQLLVAHGIPISGPGAASPASGGVDGQVTSVLMDSMKAKICEALETDDCSISDVYGDGRHVSIDVVSKLFEGKNSMQRQRMVYKAIWLELQETVHAVDAMTTKTPEEAK